MSATLLGSSSGFRLNGIWMALLATLAGAGAFAATDSPPRPAPRLRITEEIRRRVDDALRPAASQVPPRPPDTVVVLPAVRVTDTQLPLPRLTPAPALHARPFTLTEGGAFLARKNPRFFTELGCRYNPEHKGFDVLNLSW